MRVDWSPLYYHRADSLGIGFDRTAATGSGGTTQYASPLFDMWEKRATCPDEYLLWFHRVGWNEKLHSGRTLWHELCHRYQTGLEVENTNARCSMVEGCLFALLSNISSFAFPQRL